MSSLKDDVKEEYDRFINSISMFDDDCLEKCFNAGYQAALNRIINETNLKYKILSNQVEE